MEVWGSLSRYRSGRPPVSLSRRRPGEAIPGRSGPPRPACQARPRALRGPSHRAFRSPGTRCSGTSARSAAPLKAQPGRCDVLRRPIRPLGVPREREDALADELRSRLVVGQGGAFDLFSLRFREADAPFLADIAHLSGCIFAAGGFVAGGFVAVVFADPPAPLRPLIGVFRAPHGAPDRRARGGNAAARPPGYLPSAMSRYCFRIAFARARRRLTRVCIQLPS